MYNRVKQRGVNAMSNCIFIGADCPLVEVRPERAYPISINLDTGVVEDGGADDNYFLLPFPEVDIYCGKRYGVYLELPLDTDGRASGILHYIRAALEQTDCVELWNVWLSGYWEYEDRPRIHKKTLPAEEVTIADLRSLWQASNWAPGEERPNFYCLELRKQIS